MIEIRAAESYLRWWLTPYRSFGLALCLLAPLHLASVALDEWFQLPAKPLGDGMDYECIAYHLAQGRGYTIDTADDGWTSIYREYPQLYAERLSARSRQLPATGRPPLFPTLVAGVYRLVGRGPSGMAGVRVCSALCLAVAGALAASTALGLLQWKLARTHSARVATVASALGWAATVGLAGAQRTLASYARDFLTEPLALLLTQGLVTVMLVACYRLDRLDSAETSPTVGARSGRSRPMFGLAVLAGVLLGAMILCRSIFVFWLPAILGMTLLAYPAAHPGRWRFALTVVLVAVGCCSPWWLRNCVVLHSLRPLGTQGPITLLGGYSDAALAAGGEWQPGPEQELRHALRQEARFAGASDLEFEIALAQVAKRHVWNWVLEHAAEVPGMMWARVVTHWNPYTGRSLVWKLAVVAGIVCVWWYPRGCFVWLVGPLLISTMVVAVLYSVGGRFLVPFYGSLFTLAGLAIGEGAVRGERWLRPPPQREAAAPSAGRKAVP